MRVRLAERERVVEQPSLHVDQQVVERALDRVEAVGHLLAGIAPRDRDALRRKIARPDLDPQRDAAQLVVGELEPGPQVVAVVDLHAQTVRTPLPGHRRWPRRARSPRSSSLR